MDGFKISPKLRELNNQTALESLLAENSPQKMWEALSEMTYNNIILLHQLFNIRRANSLSIKENKIFIKSYVFYPLTLSILGVVGWLVGYQTYEKVTEYLEININIYIYMGFCSGIFMVFAVPLSAFNLYLSRYLIAENWEESEEIYRRIHRGILSGEFESEINKKSYADFFCEKNDDRIKMMEKAKKEAYR